MSAGLNKPSVDVSYDIANEDTQDAHTTCTVVSPEERQREAALYLKDLVTEMAQIARNSHMEVVAYLLDMTRTEVDNALRENTAD